MLKTSRVLVTVLVGALLVGGAVAAAATQHRPVPQYLALGDSLAASMQPDSDGHDYSTDEGYVEVVSRRLGLVGHSLSCGGAVTGTVRFGGAGCEKPGQASQLVRAERFLRLHPDTQLVTVDVGDNDVEHCVGEASTDPDCVASGLAAIRRNLPVIVRRLLAAAGPKTQIVGVIDYDQFLAYWLDGKKGQRAARRSLKVIEQLNATMSSVYRQAGVPVADASVRFAIEDLTTPRQLPGYGTVPLAVYRTCRWTWACSGPHLVSDDHANAAGYRQIALAVLDALGKS